jgi:sister-chromatid-cohesion protein PDS5
MVKKELHLMLAKLEQESVDTTVLSNIRKELISRSLLASKDKAVKALTACCIADILRLFAPDAPYTENELKVIFKLEITMD